MNEEMLMTVFVTEIDPSWCTPANDKFIQDYRSHTMLATQWANLPEVLPDRDYIYQWFPDYLSQYVGDNVLQLSDVVCRRIFGHWLTGWFDYVYSFTTAAQTIGYVGVSIAPTDWLTPIIKEI